MALGIDISTWQGAPDFDAIKAQKEFVIVRSSYGVGYKDVQFDRSRNELRRLNIPHGFYHYAYPQYNTPENEANWFLSVVSDLQKDEVLVLDMEENWAGFEDWKNWAAIFLETIKNRLGYKPLLYINLSKARAGDWGRVVRGDFGLWLALWDNNPNTAPQTQWQVIAMKQYSATGRVNGIGGDVDLNVFFGEVETFKRYGYQPPVAAPDVIKFEIYRNAEKIDVTSDYNSAKAQYDNMVLSQADVKTLTKFNETQNTRELLETYTEPIIPKDVIVYGVDLLKNAGIEFEFENESDALNAFEIQKGEMNVGEEIELLKINKTKSTIEKLQAFTKPEPPKKPLQQFIEGVLKFIKALIRK